MKKDELIDCVRRSFDGDAWHGPALRDVLTGINAQDAARRPPGGAHSIWELTLHVAAWANEVARRMQGNAPGEPQEGDWPVTGGSWEDAVARVFAARDRVIAELSNLTEGDLEKSPSKTRDAELGTGFTYAGMAEGLAQHNAYHGGQIMMLRRIIRAL
jgi:uncharacterized damage-inducible protein DinB